MSSKLKDKVRAFFIENASNYLDQQQVICEFDNENEEVVLNILQQLVQEQFLETMSKTHEFLDISSVLYRIADQLFLKSLPINLQLNLVILVSQDR